LLGTAVYLDLLWCASFVTIATISWNVWFVVTLEGNARLEGEELSGTSIDWTCWVDLAGTVGCGTGALADLIEWVANSQDVLGVADWVGGQWLTLSSNA